MILVFLSLLIIGGYHIIYREQTEQIKPKRIQKEK